jgi:glycosyltransferase involved in cell wall biosynthesis
MGQPSTHRSTGNARRRWTSYAGLYHDEFAPDSVWLRDSARIQLPPLDEIQRLRVSGVIRAHPEVRGLENGIPNLVGSTGRSWQAAVIHPNHSWELLLELNQPSAASGVEIRLSLQEVGFTNFLAWLGRVSGLGRLQRFRRQNRNRQVRVTRIETEAGEIIYDFSQRLSPYSIAFARRHMHLGLNIVGFLSADLGVGESARCMVRAADAAKLPSALVPLKLHCKNRLGDQTYAERFQEKNPHEVNVIHLDPPSSHDLTHHHGEAFLKGKYNIAYWAWELPEFPDAWVPCIDYYDEIWCPSDFTREAIALKSAVPVITMPHAIAFSRPQESASESRTHFKLPIDRFIFLTLFDLNSYAERKNPQAAIEAFRVSGLGTRGAVLVVKVQNAAANPADFALLKNIVAEISGVRLIAETLSRADVYRLEAACDSFVSLHRSEGFGLAVAECMYLGKPVISTNWSATAEFVNESNGIPVRASLVTLATNHGPYGKGQQWAEPDVEHAAAGMKHLFSDQTAGARLGLAARATIESHFSPAVIGARYRRRLEAIASW